MLRPKLNFMTKVTILVVALILLTASAVGFTTFPRARNLILSNLLLVLRTDVEVNSVRLVAGIEALRNDAVFLSNLPEVQGVRRAIQAGGIDPLDLTPDALWRTQLIGIFSELLVSKPHYTRLQYISVQDGLELVHVERLGDAIQVLGRRELSIGVDTNYFLAAQALQTGEVFLSDIEPQVADEAETPIRVMYASTPIYSEDGSVFGVVIVGLNFDTVFDEMTALKKDSATLYVTDQAGGYLLNTADPALALELDGAARQHIQDAFGQLEPLFEPGNTLDELPASTATQASDTALHYKQVAFDSLNPDRYLGLAIAMPYSEIVGPLDRFVEQGVWITSLMVLGGIALALVVARLLIRPLYQIMTATREISAGRFDVHLSVQSGDEFAELAASFNQMAQAIHDRENELVELNASLEQRVAARTIELKAARDEALAAQRIAQENSRLKSEFLSTMSHELRTPMNAIEGFTGIMLRRMAGVEYNEKAERYLTKVQSNSRRLLSLINDFLDLSRIESGRLELAYLPLSPEEMVQKWREDLSVLAENKGLAFDVQIDPSLPETLYGDEESLSKIAINLVGNAIKFTEKGSVSLALNRQGDHMALIVSDTGIGIPPHARDFVFDEFRQVDQSSKRKYGGTGLGLAIVQKLAREMGGTVTLQSEIGIGSTFTVLLPIQQMEMA